MESTRLISATSRLQQAEKLIDVQLIVRSAARGVVGADGATFVLRDGEQCFYLDEDAMSPLWKGQRFPLVNCISGWAMLHDEVAVVPDISKDERIPLEAYKPTFVKSLVMVPVGRGRPVAAIGAYWMKVRRATDAEIAALGELAAATAQALDRVSLDDAPHLPPTLAHGGASRS